MSSVLLSYNSPPQGGPAYPPPITTPSALAAFPDLALYAKDGSVFCVNRSVFAAATRCRHLRPALEDEADISTELDAEELELVVNFITSGIIAREEVTKDLLDAFKSLGIELERMTLEK